MYCSYRRAAFSPARTLSTLVMAWCSLHLSLTCAERQPPLPQAVAPAASTAAAAQHVSSLTLDDALLSAESRSGEVAAKASAAIKSLLIESRLMNGAMRWVCPTTRLYRRSARAFARYVVGNQHAMSCAAISLPLAKNAQRCA